MKIQVSAVHSTTTNDARMRSISIVYPGQRAIQLQWNASLRKEVPGYNKTVSAIQ